MSAEKKVVPCGTHALPDDVPKEAEPVFDVVIHSLHSKCPPPPLPPLLPSVLVTKEGPHAFTKKDIEACVANAFLKLWHAAKQFADNPEHTEWGQRIVAAIEERMKRSKVSSGPLNIAADDMLAECAATGRVHAQRGFSTIFHLRELSLFIVPERLQIK